jgi:hypothetical protein
MERLSSRIKRISLFAEGLAVTLRDRGHAELANNASDICEQLGVLEREARVFEISPGLPEFEDWKPIK